MLFGREKKIIILKITLASFPQNAVHRSRATSSSQGSSGTDTETRTLLTNAEKPLQAMLTGAIPKRRGSTEARRGSSNSRIDSPLHFVDDDVGDDLEGHDGDDRGQVTDASKNYWRHRKNLRRRPPTPPTTLNDVSSVEVDLRQRIIDILNSTSNEDCERELSKLKNELDNRSRRSALAAVASSSSATNDASNAVDDSRLSGRRRSSGGARRRRQRNNATSEASGHRERRCRHQRTAEQSSKQAFAELLGEDDELNQCPMYLSYKKF